MKKTALLTAIFFLFSGCLNPSISLLEKPPNPDGSQALADQLIIASNQDPTSLDPHAADESCAARVFNLIYDTLLDIDPVSLEIVPSLAENYQQLSDTEWLFSLRKGVYFHNGEELTAADAIASLNRARISERVKSQLSPVKDIERLSRYTFKIVLNEPYAPLPYKLCLNGCSILSEKALNEAGNVFLPVGTGAYSLTDWVVGDRVILDRFDDYFNGPSPTQRLILRSIPNNDERLCALESGAVDVAEWLEITQYTRVIENTELKLIQTPSVSVAHIALNVTKPPLDSKQVRQAIACAIDKQTLVRQNLAGNGKVADSIFGPGIPGYTDVSQSLSYDPVRAKELLAAAGYSNGFTIEALVVDSTFDFCTDLLSQNLAEIGITLKIRRLDSLAYFQAINNGLQSAHIGTWNNSVMDPDRSCDPFYSENFGAASNRMMYKNEYVDKLIREGRKQSNPQARMAVYHEIQKTVFNDAPWIPLYYTNSTLCMKKSVSGLWIDSANKHNYSKVVRYLEL